MRKPFQGVLNIIRFNRHFYIIALLFILALFFAAGYSERVLQLVLLTVSFITLSTIVISLLTSFYIYDRSGLYKLNWIKQTNDERLIININAGFDETSHLLKEKFKNAELIVLDFYDPRRHTEISIKRARKTYPPFPQTIQIETKDLRVTKDSADKIFVVLSAHEIRNETERITFFKELRKVLKPTGDIYVTEHLRDLPNFLAYNIGFFHFYPKSTWKKTFDIAGIEIKQELKLTPFISTFILGRNGNTY